MTTKERILAAAVALFNQHGTAQVSTNHIADTAGISPGNLYYHFRNKEAIIRASCDQLFALTATMFEPSTDCLPTLADVQGWVRANFAVTWQYAFVYRELPALIKHDPALAATYASVRQRGYSGFHTLIDMLREAGVLLPTVTPDICEQLADLCWLLSESWLTALDLQGVPSNNVHMQRGIDLMLLVLKPYLA